MTIEERLKALASKTYKIELSAIIGEKYCFILWVVPNNEAAFYSHGNSLEKVLSEAESKFKEL